MTNEEYKELYESANVGLWRTSIESGKFLNANLAVANILGFSSIDELVACSAPDFYDRTSFIEELKDICEIEDYEVHMRRKDGSDIWVSLSAKIFPDKGYIEGSIRDISERKKNEIAIVPHLEKLTTIRQCIMERLSEQVVQYKAVKSA